MAPSNDTIEVEDTVVMDVLKELNQVEFESDDCLENEDSCDIDYVTEACGVLEFLGLEDF